MKALALLASLALILNGCGLIAKYHYDRRVTTINLVDDRVRALEHELLTVTRAAEEYERQWVAAKADLLMCQRMLTRY